MTGRSVNSPATAGPRPTIRTLRSWSALLLMALVLSACGADDEPSPGGPSVGEGGPRVANARFDGTFVVTELTLDGRPVPLEVAPSLELETEFGGLRVEAGCNTFFGAFTLDEGGAASFTVTGGSKRACDGLERQDQLVLDGLAAVSSWTETADGFRFESPADDAVTVGR